MGGQRLERRSSHPNIVKIIKSEASEIDVAKFESEMTFKDGFPERYQRLFSYTSFPHVSRTIFMALDTISLVRCRHVCKDWSYNIDQYIINSPILRPVLLERWHNANCSIYPLTLEGNELLERKDSGAETKYRNVLSFKADENEIILAVDNGNVEIYDRATRKLTCVLVGTYSSSPVKVDFNANLIFVQYNILSKCNLKSTGVPVLSRSMDLKSLLDFRSTTFHHEEGLCLLRDVAAKAQVYWTKIKLALKSTLTGELEYVPTKTQVNFRVARS